MGSDAQSVQNRQGQDPVWLQTIVIFLRTHAADFNQHERMQFVFDRAGDNVKADYSVKSIQLQKPL